MRRRWLLLPLVMCLAACSGDAVPVGPTEAVAPEVVAESSGTVQASNGESVCHTVKFNVGGGTYPATVTGDLLGTREDFFDLPGSLKFAGATVKNAGVAHWHITGGVVPGLGDFKTSFENQNLVMDRPGSPETVFENMGKHRALEGVQKANLTYHGAAWDPYGIDHDFHGVICP